jgi:hypothetical protein
MRYQRRVGTYGSRGDSQISRIPCDCVCSGFRVVRGRTVAPVVRGWPPNGRECRASVLVTKLDSLHLNIWSRGGVLAILWEAARLALDLGPWYPGHALVEIDPLGGSMSGVRRC